MTVRGRAALHGARHRRVVVQNSTKSNGYPWSVSLDCLPSADSWWYLQYSRALDTVTKCLFDVYYSIADDEYVNPRLGRDLKFILD